MSTVLTHPLLNKDVEKLKVKNVALTKARLSLYIDIVMFQKQAGRTSSVIWCMSCV